MRLRTFRTATEALAWLRAQPFRHVGWTVYTRTDYEPWGVWVPVACGRAWKG
jgi:hypothetical protein